VRGLVAAVLGLALTAPADAASLAGIRSPSGNITCLYVSEKPQFLLCRIAEADYKAALTLHCASAPYCVDWAGFSLPAAGKGVVACAGGPAYDQQTEHPRYVTLTYGKTWHRGAFTCRSAATGITARTAAGTSSSSRAGHGASPDGPCGLQAPAVTVR
jgi:hypothetical protein